jgi:hypothetical protein
MVSTFRGKRFRKDSELLQMLEESTDSEVSSGSLFHSDENNSDSDSENLGDNPEIVDDVQQGEANENIITAGTWSNEINFDELEEHEILAGPNHNLPYGSPEKDFFDLYVGRDFCKLRQYLHLNSQENRPGPQDESFDIMYKARPVVELTEELKI